MYTSFILSTILIFCISGGLTFDCPNSPAKWCETKEIAEACGVTEQCKSYVWKVKDADKVNFTLYYESLCPGCRQFTTSQISKAFNTILDIVNISFVPYGNAHETYDASTQLYKFTCQHGAQECLGNLIHSCVLYFYPKIEQHLPFILCMEESSGDIKTVATRCASKTQIDYNQINACTTSKLGNQIQHAYAVQTDSLQPKHQYVPWVTLNGEHTEEMEDEALNDLVKLVCKTYKGSNPPPACQRQL